MLDHQAYRLVAVQVVGRIGVAVGGSLDGVHQRIDARGRGQVGGQPRRQHRIEQDDIRLERIAPQPHFPVCGVREHRGACRLGARTRCGRHAHAGQACSRKRIGAQTVVAGGRRGTGNRGHGFAEIHRRAAANRYHGLGTLGARQCRCGIGLRHRRIALYLVEGADAQAARAQRAFGGVDHAKDFHGRVGDQQHVPDRARRGCDAIEHADEIFEGAGALHDLRHAIQGESGHLLSACVAGISGC